MRPLGFFTFGFARKSPKPLISEGFIALVYRSLLHCSTEAASHEEDFTGELSYQQYLIGEGGLRPVPKRSGKWLGKHKKSSKCRWAWKSTCICALPANKRRAIVLHYAGGPPGVARSR